MILRFVLVTCGSVVFLCNVTELGDCMPLSQVICEGEKCRQNRRKPTGVCCSHHLCCHHRYLALQLVMATSQTRKIGPPLINLLRLKGVPILEQLHLEEKLLRTSSDNWCIINDGTIDPTIVMGISGKPVELLEIESVLRHKIPVIRRFTGGGTVIVDQGTIFVTFICNKDAIAGLQSYPQPIMSWSSLVYKEVFRGIGDFDLCENDYVLGNCKFGGNAQSITKNRWVHHTSFLWDYEISNMEYLKLPKRAPEYRQARGHLEFICRMKDYISRSNFIDRTMDAVSTHFLLRYSDPEVLQCPIGTKFKPSSKLVQKQELEVATL